MTWLAFYTKVSQSQTHREDTRLTVRRTQTEKDNEDEDRKAAQALRSFEDERKAKKLAATLDSGDTATPMHDYVHLDFIISDQRHPLCNAKDALAHDPSRRLAILMSGIYSAEEN